MHDGLKIRVPRVNSGRGRDLREESDIFLLTVKDEKPQRQQGRINQKGDNSRRPSYPRSRPGRQYQSTFAAVEIDCQSPGQHHAKQWDDTHEKTERSSFQGSPDGNSGVQRVCRHGLPPRRRGQPVPPGNVLRPRHQFRRDLAIGNCYPNVNLWRPALRAKRPPIFDRCPTLPASMFHVFEASAQPTGRARLPPIAIGDRRKSPSPARLLRSTRPCRCACAHTPAQSETPCCWAGPTRCAGSPRFRPSTPRNLRDRHSRN